jgi:predicted phage terminase large subunit-like protein
MIATRLDDPARGAIIVVAQRLHEDDLPGHLLEKGGWRHVSLPLVADEESIFTIGSRVWCRQRDEALIPEIFSASAIEKLRRELGEPIFQAQYQQNVSAFNGELLRQSDLAFFDTLPATANRCTLSFDTAVKTTEGSSYTVGVVIANDGGRHYIVDVLRRRLGPVEMREAAKAMVVQYRPAKILIEDASSGMALFDMLREARTSSELWPTYGKSKEERLEACRHFFVQGRVLIAKDRPWTVEFCNELLRFPNSRHDDQVDAVTQYFSWILRNPPGPAPYTARQMPLGLSTPVNILGQPLRKGENAMRPQPRKFRSRRR